MFRISERTQPDGAMSYDFVWLNGPAEGTYGFTIGQSFGWTAAGEKDAETRPAPRITVEELVAAAHRFVVSFYEPGGIGETDFPNHTPANS
nr:hypothetical protein [Microbacterium halimionae]